MNSSVIIRLPRALFERVLSDLRRPHPFAEERVGLLSTQMGTGPARTTLLFPTEYVAVPDDQYVDLHDPWVGAAINGDGIRSAMERIMATQLGVLHVHLHDRPGLPHFSPTDWRNLPDIARSFQHADPHLVHGALVLSSDAAAGAVWLPGPVLGEPVLPQVSIVGYPLRLCEGGTDRGDRTLQ